MMCDLNHRFNVPSGLNGRVPRGVQTRVRVRLDVHFHGLLRVKGLVTERALVDLGAVVRHLVELEHVVVSEGLAADVAGVGLFASVRARVHLELLGTGESLATGLADVRFFAGMSAHVNDELTALDERLGADGALVWTLARVYPHVSVEFSAVLERSVAHVALVRAFLRVDTSVHAQVLLHRERLVAVLALVGLLAGVRAVVARQSRRNRESFAADIAPVRVLALLAVGPQVTLICSLLVEILTAKNTLERLLCFCTETFHAGVYGRVGTRENRHQVRTADDAFNWLCTSGGRRLYCTGIFKIGRHRRRLEKPLGSFLLLDLLVLLLLVVVANHDCRSANNNANISDNLREFKVII